MSGLDDWIEQWDHPDAPGRDEEDRYAVYSVNVKDGSHKRVCETSETGVVNAIKHMLAESEILRGDRVGVFDRLTRQFIINPYA